LCGDGWGGFGYIFDDEIYFDLVFIKFYLLVMVNVGKVGGKGINGLQFFIIVELIIWL